MAFIKKKKTRADTREAAGVEYNENNLKIFKKM
jgi:hypothetical protein